MVGRGHDAGLDDVDGAGGRGGSQAGEEGGGEVGGEVVAHGGVVHEDTFEGVVGGELPGGHDGGAAAVGEPPAEEAQGPLLAGHAGHAVDGVAVVAALGGRQGGVMLHAHVENVGEVARDAAEEAGPHGHGDEGREGRFAAGGQGARVTRLELLVDAEPDRRVGELPQERGRDAAVEGQRAVVLDDVDKGAAHVFGRVALAHLQTDLRGRMYVLVNAAGGGWPGGLFAIARSMQLHGACARRARHRGRARCVPLL